MTKQLYEEALADVRRMKEVAVDDAKRALVEAVTPRIRDLIEKELLREHGNEEIYGNQPIGAVPGRGDADASASAISSPDEEGKVTLDLDALVCEPSDGGTPSPSVPSPMFGEPIEGNVEYEVSLESIKALTPVLSATKSGASKELEANLYRLGEQISKFKMASRIVRESAGFNEKITEMISRVDDMYDYVQESITVPAKKNSYEVTLESYFQDLNKLQERKMSKKSLKKMMNEEDVTLKLTGLPDDIDLDSVGVDLITGEEGEGDELDLGGDGSDGEGDEGGDDLDLDNLDLGGEEGEDTQMGESRRLSDDTIVEIDEGMLRREIARMKSLREETKPDSWGNGPGGANILHNFGGGKDEGDPHDQEISDLSPAKGSRPLGEADDDEDMDESDQMDESDDEDMDEATATEYGDDDDDDMDESQDQMDEQDDDMNQGFGMDQAEDPHSVGGNVAPAGMGAGADSNKQSRSTGMSMESVKRKISFEKRLQERAKSRGAALKKEARRSVGNKKKVAALQQEYAAVGARFNESIARSNKLSRMLAEAKKPRNAVRQNGVASRSAGSTDVGLRAKLAETNLFNAKLLYTNKLLQNDGLSKKQKAQMIERLDEANNLREVKLVYESLSKTLAGTSRPLSEGADRKVLGSSSKAQRPGSTNLSEGYETDRWAQLAGITKR